MHAIDVELLEPVPEEVPVGAEVVLKLEVSCPQGCDLSAMPLTLTGPDEKSVTIRPQEQPREIGAFARRHG